MTRPTTGAGFPSEYALANRADHPKTVYLREADITGSLDAWLGQVFGPARLDATLAQLARPAEVGNDHTSARFEAAQARIAVLDQKIAQYRARLDARGRPRRDRPADRRDPGPANRRPGRDPIRYWTTPNDPGRHCRDRGRARRPRANHPGRRSARQADRYAQLGVRMTYRPQIRLVEAMVTPSLHMRTGFVSEGDLIPETGEIPRIGEIMQ